MINLAEKPELGWEKRIIVRKLCAQVKSATFKWGISRPINYTVSSQNLKRVYWRDRHYPGLDMGLV